MKSLFWGTAKPDPVFVGRSLHRAIADAKMFETIAANPAVGPYRMTRIYVFSACTANLLMQHIVGRHYSSSPARDTHAEFFNIVSDQGRDAIKDEELPHLSISTAFVHGSQRAAVIGLLRSKGVPDASLDSLLPAEIVYSFNRMFLARDFSTMLGDVGLLDSNISMWTVGKLGRFVQAFICTGAWAPEETMPLDVDHSLGEFGAYVCGCIRTILDGNPFR